MGESFRRAWLADRPRLPCSTARRGAGLASTVVIDTTGFKLGFGCRNCAFLGADPHKIITEQVRRAISIFCAAVAGKQETLPFVKLRHLLSRAN